MGHRPGRQLAPVLKGATDDDLPVAQVQEHPRAAGLGAPVQELGLLAPLVAKDHGISAAGGLHEGFEEAAARFVVIVPDQEVGEIGREPPGPPLGHHLAPSHDPAVHPPVVAVPANHQAVEWSRLSLRGSRRAPVQELRPSEGQSLRNAFLNSPGALWPGLRRRLLPPFTRQPEVTLHVVQQPRIEPDMGQRTGGSKALQDSPEHHDMLTVAARRPGCATAQRRPPGGEHQHLRADAAEAHGKLGPPGVPDRTGNGVRGAGLEAGFEVGLRGDGVDVAGAAVAKPNE